MSDKKKKAKKGTPGGAELFVSRELSWLDFNERVLRQAERGDYPGLEKLRFLAIASANMEEFFMVRVAALKEQARAGYKQPDQSGLAAHEQLERLGAGIRDFFHLREKLFFEDVLPDLEKGGVRLLERDGLTDGQRAFCAEYFDQNIYPLLTPMVVDGSHPLMPPESGRLYLAVMLSGKKGPVFSLIPLPETLERLIRLPGDKGADFIALEELVALHLPALFQQVRIKAAVPFCLVRNADILVEEEAEDLVQAISQSVRSRKRGKAVSLEMAGGAPEQLREFVLSAARVRGKDVYETAVPVHLPGYMSLCDTPGLGRLRLKKHRPAQSHDFRGREDLFAAIAQKDRMVCHPYEGFDCVLDFLTQAARDPSVLAIKQTLYRVGPDAPVIELLAQAARNGKQVTVLLELKARFDEENNIHCARRLEEAGCHVVFGMEGLKVHCKALMVVRGEKGLLRRYVHLATGNYNQRTAAQYTDVGLFTADRDVGADVSALFNVLTGHSNPRKYRKLAASPQGMRTFLLERMDGEIAKHMAGQPCGITAKMNALVDGEMIEKLYQASCAGVPVDLTVRGICCLRAAVPGLSEHITVRSIIGDFLEHSRIFAFGGPGEEAIYLGSADWMSRNLDRRIEVLFPVEDELLRRRIRAILEAHRADTTAFVLDGDGVYRQRQSSPKAKLISQRKLADLARSGWGENAAPVPKQPEETAESYAGAGL